MGKFVDRTGLRYGRLQVLCKTDKRTESGAVVWNCLCNCGKETQASGSSLTAGDTNSCGCLHADTARAKGLAKKTHGMTRTPTYRAWAGAHGRCNNKTNAKYPLYGGRGIKVCSEWDSFARFLQDMGPAPAGHSLDRIDVNGDYTPANCRWATQLEQQNNRRDNVIIDYAGERMTMAMYCRKHGLNSDKVQQRLKRGYSVEQAVAP